MDRQYITILGATGSIGLNALAVIDLHPDLFQIFALTSHSQKEKLLKLCVQYQPAFAVMTDEKDAAWLRSNLSSDVSTEVLSGTESINLVASHPMVDTVIAAIVGAAGAIPTFAAAQAGKKILLANKETLVMAGDLFYRTVVAGNASVLPVDSEHNAIFQVLPKNPDQIKKIILTASGGPFLDTEIHQLDKVTVAQAVNHPNWKMGRKISIDSATMMNKALEVIEASWLFNLSCDKIDVIIHPESIIHSMVRLVDESVLAQLAVADMKIPIEYCLAYPDRINSGARSLDFSQMSTLHFMQVDKTKFPALDLAYDVLNHGLDSGCILNAANEVATTLFLQGQIKFTDIYVLVVAALNHFELESHADLGAILHKDERVRGTTKKLATKLLI